jgi:hypothetical protein
MKTSKKAPRQTPAQAKKKTKRRAATKAPARKRHYDPDMIRDFLMQLRIELQDDQIARAQPDVATAQRSSGLDPFLEKHGTRLLYKIGFGEVTEEQQAEIDRTLASARQKQLEALEFLLETAFKEALACAAEKQQSGKAKSITFSPDDWTKWTRNGSA